MCGITGIISQKNTNGLDIFKSLLAIQHRGQDGAGIFWSNNGGKKMIKGTGLVNQIFSYEQIKTMIGSLFTAHNRYKTNNIKNAYQPIFYDSSSHSVSVCHNGNITNVGYIQKLLETKYLIPFGSEERSDSDILAQYIFEILKKNKNRGINFENIIELSNELHKNVEGSFSLIIGIPSYGMVAIRDKQGIRPLCYGKNNNNDYLVSSESCSFNHTNFNYVDEVKCGETIFFTFTEKKHYSYLTTNEQMILNFKPCLFEYIYFSRIDSIFNNIAIYKFRKLLGELMGKKLRGKKFDIIVPVPETSRSYANSVSNFLNIQIQEAIILNRYVNRTFIIENKHDIIEKIRQKFSIIGEMVKDKNVLLIDDSIVRGNTSKGIISELKNHGAKRIGFASAAPKVYNTNKYGIHIEKKEELLTSIAESDKNIDLAKYIGIDEIFYTDLNDVIDLVKNMNPSIQQLEISMFEK